MTSDYSRSTFNARKHYHAVRMQQGRVQLDADWNEQVDITAHQLRQRTRDMLGPSGAPVDSAGFALEVEQGKEPQARLFIGAGRYYVDGLLCENEERVPWEEQPDDPGSEQPREPGVYLAVLDVWERTISAYEDPEIREVALGGPDTGVRAKTVWQVRALRVYEDPDAADQGLLDEAWWRFLLRHTQPGHMRARRRPGVATELPGNQLYRVEIQDEGERAGGPLEPAHAWPTLPVMPAPGEQAWLISRTKQLALHLWRPGRYVEVVAEHGRHLARLIKVNTESGWLELSSPLPPGAGTPRLLRPIASFKWSRNNGTEVLPVSAVLDPPERPQVRLGAPLGTRGVELRAGDLVEAVDMYTVLRGEPAPLRRILSVAEDRHGVTLDGELPAGWGHDPNTRPLLRRWDHAPGAGAPGPLPVGSEWLELEHGVQVQFSGDGGYRPGNHWVMAARTRTGTVEWPQHEGAPLALRPHGGQHHFCQLAVLRVDAQGRSEVEDRRTLFAPLSRGAAPTQPEGPVTFPEDVRVLGALRVDAELDAGSIRGQLAHETVGTHQLREGAVTSRKLAPGSVHLEHLAPEVGTVPVGFCVLGASPQPPPGYEPGHLSVQVLQHHARWEPGAPLPGDPAGRVVLVTLEQSGYALLDNGQVWRCDAQGQGWELISHLPQPQPGFAAAVLGHRIHVLGGRDMRGRPLARHVAFEPPSKNGAGRWTVLRPMPTPRELPGAVSAEGQLFVLGGLECWPLPWWGGADRPGRPAWLSWLRRASGRVEVYEPSRDIWQVARRLPVPRSHFGVAEVRGRLHVVGGQRKRLLLPARPLARHEQFDPLTNRWAKLAPLERPRAELAAAAVDERLYVVGGHQAGAPLEEVERYSFTSDTWQPEEPLSEPLRSPGTAMLPGRLLVTGGTSPAGPRASSHLLEVAALLYLHRRRDTPASPARAAHAHAPLHPSPAPTAAPESRGASRSPMSRRHFRTPRFAPAPTASQRVWRLGVLAIALAAITVSLGMVLRPPLLPAPPPPLEALAAGIDISHHQGQVDWEAVLQQKPGFVFMKASEGLTLSDPEFQRNWSALSGSGVPRGAYHFYRPQDDAEEQARFFLSHLKLEASDLPPVLDVEVTDAKHTTRIIAGVRRWLELVEQATNRRPILYSYTAFWREHLGGGFQDYPLWLAGNPATVDRWAFWQRGDKGKVGGISNCVDENVFRGSAEDLRLFVQTGQLPRHQAPSFPLLPSKCHRPTHSPEPPVPVRVASADTSPSQAQAGPPPLPPFFPGDVGPAQALPYQAGMTPHPPELMHAGLPLTYTGRALEARISGMAIVLCTIQISGRVTDCTVVKSLPFLDHELEVMMTSRVYQPMSFHGQPVAVRYPFYLNVQPPPEYEP